MAGFFRKIPLEAIHNLLNQIITDENDREWLSGLNHKYLLNSGL
ncbi:MAG TPA: hypothetical protein P5228_01180 [Bacteroidales bacterium]|nr:hypothetical protein [Bacteroidales bacterium]HRZ49158.1 hypothetical protein [Bacteroidales bacterium]